MTNMKRPETTGKIPPRTVLRYALLQVPGLVLLIAVLFYPHDIFQISVSLKYIIIIFWVSKDAIMFPFVWRSYDPAGFNPVHTMRGKIGVALEHLDPEGYIMVNGERWKACAAGIQTSIEKGSPVEVVEMHGLCLHVHLWDNSSIN